MMVGVILTIVSAVIILLMTAVIIIMTAAALISKMAVVIILTVVAGSLLNGPSVELSVPRAPKSENIKNVEHQFGRNVLDLAHMLDEMFSIRFQ